MGTPLSKSSSLLILLIAALPFSVVAEEGEKSADEGTTQTAVFGAGCFWCVEAFYENLPGVVEVVSGYAGGEKPNPAYKEVAMGRTKHAEVVEVVYDPDVISYRELVDFFWKTHDATDGRGVWPDFGPQYRSTILYSDEEQRADILVSKKALEESGAIEGSVATVIEPLTEFYPAEDYHQDYVVKNPNDRYVRGVYRPKMKKLQQSGAYEIKE